MSAPAWATPEPGMVQVVRLHRQAGRSAEVQTLEGWEPVGLAPARGLFLRLAEQLPFAPRCIDVQVTHGYPEPTAQLLDGGPLDRHETLAVLQVLVYGAMRLKRVPEAPAEPNGPETAEGDNPGLSVVHRCPPLGAQVTPCCGRQPGELPFDDRLTINADAVTCDKAGLS